MTHERGWRETCKAWLVTAVGIGSTALLGLFFTPDIFFGVTLFEVLIGAIFAAAVGLGLVYLMGWIGMFGP